MGTDGKHQTAFVAMADVVELGDIQSHVEGETRAAPGSVDENMDMARALALTGVTRRALHADNPVDSGIRRQCFARARVRLGDGR